MLAGSYVNPVISKAIESVINQFRDKSHLSHESLIVNELNPEVHLSWKTIQPFLFDYGWKPYLYFL